MTTSDDFYKERIIRKVKVKFKATEQSERGAEEKNGSGMEEEMKKRKKKKKKKKKMKKKSAVT